MKRLTKWDWFDRLTSHKDVPSLWSDSVLNDNTQPEFSSGYAKSLVWCVLIFLGAIFGVAVYGIWRAV